MSCYLRFAMSVQSIEALVSIEALERALARALDAWPAVRAAWLFGSVAQGTDGAASDIDVAVLGADALSFDERAQLVTDLARAVSRPCDVVTVEHASPVLGHEIVETGRRFLDRDAVAADRWEDFAIRRYLDTAQLRRLVYQYVRDDFGGSTR